MRKAVLIQPRIAPRTGWLPVAFILLLLLKSQTGKSQYDWRSYIDTRIQFTDSLALKTQRAFFLTKYLRNNDSYKENWYYTKQGDRIIVFEIRYMLDSVEYNEIYYLDQEQPICVERYETIYSPNYEDDLKRGEVLLFRYRQLKQYVTVGMEDQYFQRWSDPAYTGLQRFATRYTELKRHLPIVEF